MKNKKYLILYFVILVIILQITLACQNEKSWTSKISTTQEFINIFPKEFEINSEVYINDTINLLNPFSVEILGNLIWVMNQAKTGSNLISIFDMNSKDYIGDILKVGRGPNEYNNAICHNITKDTLFVLDFYATRASLFSIEKVKSLSNTPDRIVNFKTYNSEEYIYKTISLNNNFICSGGFAQGRFTTFSMNGIPNKKFGQYPSINFNDTISNYHLGNLFGGNLWFCSNSNSSKLAAINKYSLTLFDYNKNDETYTEYFNVEWWKPEIVNAGYLNDKLYVGRTAKGDYYGAGSIVAKNGYLFFPYSEFSIADAFMNGIENRYNYIMVMDWEGVPLARFKLDKSISSSLTIDNEANYLYSIHTDLHTGFPQIVRFSMHDIITKTGLN